MRVAVGQYLFFLFFLVVQHWEAGFSSATENVAAPVSSPKVSAGAQSPRAADAPQQPFAAAPTKPEQNERSTAAAVEKVATPAVSRKPKAAAALYGLLTLLFLGLSLYSVSWEEELEESDDDEGEGDGAEYRSISKRSVSYEEARPEYPCKRTYASLLPILSSIYI
ncbi:hypothetical protein EMWEY_00020460 [Eimeria maxima]|uniref:Transmembrane protein n=1 Tax=Eimeria maxima TaxID=5804 RepID=U6M2E1_EIMMA|nr:hypothetical protein EMWEY_00020460 [Eimeria maxima]CDJ56584.1 hypothetical protein EMWEY_00020460 [Eimeria maxima]